MIPIARPVLGAAEIEATRRVVESGWLTQGSEVTAFEQEFAAFVGAADAIAVSNCTAALHLALLALGVGSGDEVITVSHSFIATANAIRYCGAIPIFVDIQSDTYNIDPAAISAAVGPRTRAILCVHQMGLPCDLKAILEVAAAHCLPVIEDAACAIGSEIQWGADWQRIGRAHGDIVCFSFHPRKVITTGEGGMITTGDPSISRQIRLLRQHGMTVPDTVRHASSQVIFEAYPAIGYNYRMTDLSAAIGREQLRRLPEIYARRRALAAIYDDLLSDPALLGCLKPHEPDWARSNWQSYCVRLPDRADQHGVMQSMLDDGVATRRGIMCAHREETYRAQPQRFPLDRSEKAQDSCILLPLYPQMTTDDQVHVVKALANAIRTTLPVLSQGGLERADREHSEVAARRPQMAH